MRDPQSLVDACIHCGLCLDACPTYAEIGAEPDSPRGRIYFMRALLEGRAQASADLTTHLDTCLGCRACETACPSGVEYGHLLETVRAKITEPQRPAGLRSGFWRLLIRRVMPDRRAFRLLTLPLRLLALGPTHWLPAFLRRQVDMFPPAQPHGPLPHFTPAAAGKVYRGRAGFLAGCVMPVLYPAVNAAAVRLLADSGFDVVVPEEAGCCGAIQAHDGDAAGASVCVSGIAAAYAACDVVVSNAAGCGAAMKGYPDGFGARARDLSEALVEADWQPSRKLLGPNGRPLVVAYHDPCHLSHGQKVRSAPRELLRRCGVRLVDVAEADYCCGGAGTYTLLQPDLSERLMVRKTRNLMATEPDVVVTANPSCMMQIRRGLLDTGNSVPVLHLAEILERAGRLSLPAR